MKPDEWLGILNGPEYEWSSWQQPVRGVSSDEWEQLVSWCGRPLPDDYAAFLRLTNGADVWHAPYGTLRFWPSHDIPRFSSEAGVRDLPGAFAFGDDTAEEILVFDTRPCHPDGRYPVYAVDAYSVHDRWEGAIRVADTFTSLILLRSDLLHEASKEAR